METAVFMAAFWPALADGNAALCMFSHPLLLLIPLGALLLSYALQRHPNLHFLLLLPCVWLAVWALWKAGHLFRMMFPANSTFLPGMLLCALLSLWLLNKKESGMLLFILPALPLLFICFFLPRQPMQPREMLSIPDTLLFLLPAAAHKKPAPGKDPSPFPRQTLLLFDLMLLQYLALIRLPAARIPLAALSQPFGKGGHIAACTTLYLAAVLQCFFSLRGIRYACQSVPRLFAFLPRRCASRKGDNAG